MIIKVTQKHINKGKPGDSDSCPIALAFREQVPNVTDISVYEEYMEYYTEEDGFRQLDFSQKATQFVNTFDTHGKNKVKPFNFKITL